MRSRDRWNVLLLEPNYKNKYPPMGLMKISKYHKVRGDIVIFYKGEMDKDKFCNYKFDRIYITTLFTFNYKQTVKAIKYYENLLPASQIYIGGIMTTLLNKRLMSIFQFYREQKIPADPDKVWEFIASPANLKRITPDYMGFDINSKYLPEKMYPGMMISYTVKPLLGIKMNWITEIPHVQEKDFFIVQSTK